MELNGLPAVDGEMSLARRTEEEKLQLFLLNFEMIEEI